MKANRSVAATAGLAAMAMAWWRYRSHQVQARKVQMETKSMQEALDTLEGEGGLVLS